MDIYTRQQMVLLIEDLCVLKGYKDDTFYLATSIADRYLSSIAVDGQKAPCLITLAVISNLLACKLEEPISPCYDNIIHTLQKRHNANLNKQEVFDMEEAIIK